MATAQALISQKTGATVPTAWPQVTPNGIAPQNLDLLQIATDSDEIVVSVDNKGTVLGSLTKGLVLTQVAVVGQVVTYTGTIPNGAAAVLKGKTAKITGFATAGNNVVFQITSSSTTTLVGVKTTQANETHAGNAIVYTPNQVRIGKYITRQPNTATLAQFFANAFYNPSHLDILQVVNIGGNVHYALSYLGVATGS